MSTAKRNRVSRTALVALAMVAIAATGSLFETRASDDDTYIARFTGRTYVLGQTGTAVVRVGISAWSSDEERGELLDALKEGGTKGLTATLEKAPDHGWVTVGKSRQTLRYARMFEQDGLRRIILATDRPLGAAEVMKYRRTQEYTVSLLELRLPEKGKGEGTLAIGVELTYDAEENVIEIENFGSQAARIVNVKQDKK
jgi:hypothetical protein